MIYQRELREKYKVDVFIAGGGPAGIAAALAAARCGKKVFLAESQGCFGGAATSALVPFFANFDDGEKVISKGIGWEIRQQVSKQFPLDQYWVPLDAEELKRTYDRLLKESGVQYSFFTTLCDVITQGKKVEGIVLSAKSGMFSVKAKIYIDCTGDGDLCAFGGGAFEKGDEHGNVMSPTLCTLWANVDFSKSCSNVYAPLKKAIEDGIFTYPDPQLCGISECNAAAGIAGGNLGHVFGTDSTDERSLTEAMQWGRLSALEYQRYYREYLTGYENMTLVATGSVLGTRESRRITCDYTLNENDFLNRAVFPDEIGRHSYPVDIHVMQPTQEEHDRFKKENQSLRYGKGESYGIPYRSLIPVSFSNVLVAGRCIGTDRKMQSSIRTMPCCFVTGQAAGVAATLATDSEDVRSISVKQLQQALIHRIGAYLPNAEAECSD